MRKVALLGVGAILWAVSCGDLRPGLPGYSAPYTPVVNITIPPGATNFGTVLIQNQNQVIWTNQDQIAHTVTSDQGLWDSGPIQPGQTFSRVFPDTGNFPYHCTIHPEEKGVIEVNSRAYATGGPSPSVNPSPSGSPIVPLPSGSPGAPQPSPVPGSAPGSVPGTTPNLPPPGFPPR